MSPRRSRRVRYAALAAVTLLVGALRPALATIEEQRARLPPPAACHDPIEGVWMSHQYEPDYNDWYIFTLTIHRNGDRLSGTSEAHSWTGGPVDAQPPPCRPGLSDWTVEMPAEGTIDSTGRIEFHGTSWTIGNVACGPRPFGYNVDSFMGVVDSVRQEFQSVDNDNGRAINEPTVFRRIRCLDQAPQPHVPVAPPPFVPPSRTSGCGCK